MFFQDTMIAYNEALLYSDFEYPILIPQNLSHASSGDAAKLKLAFLRQNFYGSSMKVLSLLQCFQATLKCISGNRFVTLVGENSQSTKVMCIPIKERLRTIHVLQNHITVNSFLVCHFLYRKLASSNTSRLKAQAGFQIAYEADF